MGVIIIDYPGDFSVLMMEREKEEHLNQKRRSDDGSRGQGDAITGFEQKTSTKAEDYKQLQPARKDKKTDFLLQSS